MDETSGAAGGSSREPPLVVDLDGTLITTDCLFEGAARMLARSPLQLLLLPWWLLRGKAALKREIADRTQLDVAVLPYNQRLIELLVEQRQRRRVLLCTSTHHRYADAIAAHLRLFDGVIATDDSANLGPEEKVSALVERYGAGQFDYAGNAAPDLAVFAKARHAIVVNPTFALKRSLGRIGNLQAVQETRPGFSLAPYLRVMRPHQWIKNLLVFVPLLATLDVSNPGPALAAVLAFVSFTLVASSVYVLNDLSDLAEDRRHPRKRHRPLASGSVPIEHGLVMIPALLIGGLLVASRLSPLFVTLLLLYWASTNLYTFRLKRVPLLDTLVLAGLYTLRIFAGAAAIAVTPSVWLISFSMFFFLSLALAKRHSELVEAEEALPSGNIPGREYWAVDLSTLIAQGSSSGYVAVLVLALYIDSSEVRTRYDHPEVIWLICPLVLYWINKLWLNSQRRQLHGDPIVWSVQNRVSRAIVGLCVVLLLLARWLP